MFAWTKEDVLNMKLPEEWTKGVFEISVEDPTKTLMLIWIVGEASRAGYSKSFYAKLYINHLDLDYYFV